MPLIVFLLRLLVLGSARFGTLCHTSPASVTDESTDEDVNDYWFVIARGNRIIPFVGDIGLCVAIETFLVSIVINLVCTLNVRLQCATLSAVLPTNVAHRPMSAPYCAFSSTWHMRSPFSVLLCRLE